jgi:FAD/FMN-containing dehydrogenase
LDDLRSRLTGRLLLPGQEGFRAASVPANGRYRMVTPVAVAQVADEADVVTCVTWCTENGVSPTGRGGGHSYAGFSTTEGLLIDLHRLNSVTVDRASATAVSGGAALNLDFFKALSDGPLVLPGGTCLGVGVGGLVLGGGIGYNTHWAGLTADHLVATRIVTADGQVREVDATNEPDLYWALRGGAGGSFGINTSFTFSLAEIPVADVAWYRFDWYGADAAGAVLAAFDALIGSAPPAFNAVAMAEAIEAVGGDKRAAIHTMSRGQYMGPVDELEDLIAPLRAAATPERESVGPRPYWDVARTIATTEPPSHSFGDISRYADAPVPVDAIEDMVDLLVECPSRDDDNNGSIWSLGWVGGSVMNSIGRTDTAYVHRGMQTLWRPTTVWDDVSNPEVGVALNEWTDAVIAVLEPVTPNESYQNFPNRAIKDWQTAYYAENLERLIDVKTAVDPGDLFHNAQSIPTRG